MGTDEDIRKNECKIPVPVQQEDVSNNIPLKVFFNFEILFFSR